MKFLPSLKNKIGSLSASNEEVFGAEKYLQRPIYAPSCIRLIKDSLHHLEDLQEKAKQDYALGEFENWDYNQELGLITFYDGALPQLEIKYHSVGSISKADRTWLWAWANPDLNAQVKSEIVAMREYGVENEFEPFVKSKWYGDEYDGWEMAAVSALVLNAKGAYNIPQENTYDFVIFNEIRDLR